MSRVTIVGLTGGIAAGKSTVAEMFGELGCAVVDADQLSREVMREPDLVQQLVQVFGPGVLDDQVIVDRRALGARVFSDPRARGELEAITHPAIAAAARRTFEALGRSGHRQVLYEAALLVETGRHEEMDLLVVVVADQEVRVQRLMRRSDLTRDEALARLDSQLPQQAKAALADYLIDNSQSLEQTRQRVVEAWGEILRRIAQQEQP